jgi:hypothetical protein
MTKRLWIHVPTNLAPVLGIVVLTLTAGCGSAILSGAVDQGSSGDGATFRSPTDAQRQIPDCRNRGVYNRAADGCVSEGP